MFDILIVEDEIPAIESIKLILESIESNFKIANVAFNGKQGYDKYLRYKPDLIITDIEMPIMDGLELIRKVREQDSQQEFVILSCHENFHYAREAVRLNVSEYLIKDLLTPEDLLDVLNRIENKLRRDNSSRDAIKLQHSSDQFSLATEAFIIANLITQDLPYNKKNDYIKQMNINANKKFGAACLKLMDSSNIKKSDHVFKDSLINEIFMCISEELKETGYCTHIRNGEFALLLLTDDVGSKHHYTSQCYGIANNIRNRILKDYKINIFIGISDQFNSLHDLDKKYNQAYDLTKYSVFFGVNKIIFSNNVVIGSLVHVDPSDLDKKLLGIKTYVKKGDYKQVKNTIEELYFNDIRGFMQFNYLKHVNAVLLGYIFELCNEYGIKYNEIFDCDYIPVEIVDNLNSIEEIVEWFCNVFEKIINVYANSVTETKYSRNVRDAIDYINSYYHHKISLDDIAQSIGIHSVYLSKIFKQETGKNIIEYIREKRIKEAKELLISTNYKIYEIAEKLGYKYVQHFNNDFYKITNQSPSEFRERNS